MTRDYEEQIEEFGRRVFTEVSDNLAVQNLATEIANALGGKADAPEDSAEYELYYAIYSEVIMKVLHQALGQSMICVSDRVVDQIAQAKIAQKESK